MKKIPNPWYGTTIDLRNVYGDFVILTGLQYGDIVKVSRDRGGSIVPHILKPSSILDYIDTFYIEEDDDEVDT